MSEKDEVLSSIEIAENKKITIPERLSILPLRDIVIFPYMIFPVLIGRTSSLRAIAEAVERDKFIFVSAQKSSATDEPAYKDIYTHGTTAKIIQILRLPNSILKVLVEGLFQSKIKKAIQNNNYLEAIVSQVKIDFAEINKELTAMMRRVSELFSDYVRVNHNIPPDVVGAYENIEDPVKKLYYASANVLAKVEIKQKILEQKSLYMQFFELSKILTSELEILKIEDEIDTKVQETMQKSQKKYYIQEQIRALQKELEADEESSPELTALKESITKAEMPDYALAKAIEEFERLKKTPTMSPEYSVNRTFLEFLCSVPWSMRTDDNLDIEHVRKILDEDHYDLEKPKERILEFIAVLNFVESLKKQILCFVGPPGVGKTSLARSIARALGRNFVRFSLGGIRDEAEIRGHRRTYIGALPGKIIQSMKKAGTVNPVVLLDEVDKMSMDFRGDPSAALLEVLDPEQNVAFNDHYLEVDYDLSNVMFITTANVQYDIPLPLQDRMEIIHLNSYIEPEKLEIAKKHIIPKLLQEYGLDKMKLELKDTAIQKIINEYTREAGVRHLEREIGSIFRKLAKDIVQEYDKKRKMKNGEPTDAVRQALHKLPQFKKQIASKNYLVDEKLVEKYLKAPRFKFKKEDLAPKVGVATGLAWTSVGGDILPIEVTIMPGTQKLTLTGKLGDVMKESAAAALSYVRSKYKELGIEENFHKNKEIHVHVPEGAIPKDGPSAGITIGIALISAASGRAVRGDVAMTGEITLRGNILPIGGLNEKLLAAKRVGIKKVIIPKENERDIEEIKESVKKDMEIVLVKHISEAISLVIEEEKKRKK